MKVRYYRDEETAGSESRYFQSFVIDLFSESVGPQHGLAAMAMDM